MKPMTQAYIEGYEAVGEVEDGFDGNPFEEGSDEYADWAAGYSQKCDDEDSEHWDKNLQKWVK